jgi:DNA invertase Pin-like site-specific DNA recombinase
MSRKVVAVRDLRATMPVLMALVAALALTAVAPASASAQTGSSPVLAQGAGMGAKPDAAVRSLQRVLRHRGYDLGAPGVDGRFGPLTAAAVRHLQADYGLPADGVVGAKTSKLLRLLKPQRRSTRPSESRTPRSTPDRGAGRGIRRPQPAPTQARATGNDNTSWLPAAAIAAVLAALCAALGTLLLDRRRQPIPEPIVAPINHGLYVEGRSDEEDVGEFRGHAVATAITGDPEDPPAADETRYLVNDVRKPAPVWVRAPDIRRAPTRLATGNRVIGYLTLNNEGGGERADGPVQGITEACEHAGWELVDMISDRDSGRGLERPGLSYALRQVAERKADGLVVSDLRLLCRSIIDLGTLMAWFRDAHAALVALDLGVDTSTPAGEELAAKLITLGEWEHERISRRTRSGLEEARAGGGAGGRPAVSDQPELAERITAMRASGMTLQAIADQLNAEEVPTMRGGTMWRPSSVQAALGYRRPGSRSPRDQLPSLEEDRQS